LLNGDWDCILLSIARANLQAPKSNAGPNARGSLGRVLLSSACMLDLAACCRLTRVESRNRGSRLEHGAVAAAEGHTWCNGQGRWLRHSAAWLCFLGSLRQTHVAPSFFQESTISAGDLHSIHTYIHPTLLHTLHPTLLHTSLHYTSTLQTHSNLHNTYIQTLQKPLHPTYLLYRTYLESPTCLPYPYIPTKLYNPYTLHPTLHARPTPAHLLNQHVVRRCSDILPVIGYYVLRHLLVNLSHLSSIDL